MVLWRDANTMTGRAETMILGVVGSLRTFAAVHLHMAESCG